MITHIDIIFLNDHLLDLLLIAGTHIPDSSLDLILDAYLNIIQFLLQILIGLDNAGHFLQGFLVLIVESFGYCVQAIDLLPKHHVLVLDALDVLLLLLLLL